MNISFIERFSRVPLRPAAWLAAAAALLAACGGGGSTPETAAPATVDRAETAAATAVRIDGVYRLENRCSGKVLDVAGISTALRARIHLWEWWGGANQQWRIEPLGDGTHRLVAQHSGHVLDAPPDAVNEDGVPLFHQWDWHGGANQRFVIEDLGDGSHRLTVQHSQKLLDVRGAGTANGTTIWQWPWNGSCAQRWVLTRLDGDSLTPVATRVQAGQGQQATANTVVATRPAIRVLDRVGRGVANMRVTFVVVAGGGSVTGADQVTDANGVATVGSWRLGAEPGANTLSARTAGLPEVTFNATATAAVGQGLLEALAGTDNQSAATGSAVTSAPAVLVRDAAGVPRSGVSVNFAVTAGGGTVANAVAVSDANGVAGSGRWTLGPNAGAQTLTASAAGFASRSFSATAVAGGVPAVTRNVFLGGLAIPWDMAFAPDGTALYTERAGGLSVRLTNGTVRRLFAPADLVAQDQSGMLGVALDPDFVNTRRVYLYMASNAGGATDNRIVRVTVNADYTAVGGRADIVTGIAYAGGAHSGGRIRFGADWHLYITTGDNRTGTVPQDPRVLGGKVLRVDRDGNAVSGNNPPPNGNPRIFTYGHRNPQGLAFRPGNGALFLIEHGPNFQDEVTPIFAGGNGGWDPRCATGGGYCGYDNVTQMTDLVKYPGAMRPAWTSGNAVGSSRGTAGGAFVSGAQWRDWNGALVIAMLSGRRLEVLRLTADGNGTLGTAPLFDTLGQRLRFVVQGPDGALYVGTDGRAGGDEIWRVTPQ
jgi:glucose/arabinose dehydrogenase